MSTLPFPRNGCTAHLAQESPGADPEGTLEAAAAALPAEAEC